MQGDIGVLPPLGVYDPLGLISKRNMARYEVMEIKHGRAAMLGFLHVIAIEAGVRLPGYLSVSQDLKFSDVPAGCFASLEAVPTAGWLQIMVRTFLTVPFFRHVELVSSYDRMIVRSYDRMIV